MDESDIAPRIGALQVTDIPLPKPVDRLHDLAYNLWWTWSIPARRLFGAIDAASWARYRNPVELLLNVDHRRWEPLLDSDSFMDSYRWVIRSLDRYMDPSRDTWYRTSPAPASGPVAYFSMEYGLHQSLTIYSGGLGVLSGDHLKSASDLGIPLVAIGLLYRHGYFRQTIDADGFQQHIYPEVDFNRLPIRPALDGQGRELTVRLPLVGEGDVAAKVWVAQVGRVPLLLLDTDVADNEPADRAISGVLYVRGRESRLLQEIVLGIGGARALEALGIRPAVWHINEGHSSLLQLERLRGLVEDQGVPLDAALERVRSSTVFTTHTPVPAGNEQYDRRLTERYLEPWAERLGLAADELLDMGAADHGEVGQPFNLSAFALRTSSWANGVSRLNAEVADRMWRHVVPGKSEDEPAVEAITNGIHLETWLGREMHGLFERSMGTDCFERLYDPEVWKGLEQVEPAEIWEAHSFQRERLLHFVHSRLRQQQGRHGRSPREMRELEKRVGSRPMIVGFARRFATYKRAALLFSDIHRLRALLGHPERPLQIFIAGKAHPADRPAQDLIRHIFQLSQEPDLRGRIVFLENHDLRVARKLVQGVDLWLNTPRRLMEASGTSGMKAAANGVLNCSILDGWWPEAYDGTNGWAIGPAELESESDDEDGLDALALYHLLEEEILPLYYERNEDGVPLGWVERMRSSITSVGDRFSAGRMVREYFEFAYAPRSGAPAGERTEVSEAVPDE